MSTTIEVNKKSVKQLLESGKEQRFVIPEYQRPYEWTDEHIQTLFDDLTEYTKNDNESTYFLGTIVSFLNSDHEQEIIDGQQRITSLFLLLRALYAKLCTMTETKEVKNFKSQIESALWEQEELTADVDFEKPLITSKVMGEEGNMIFANILTKGTVQPKAKDNYSKNFLLFKELIESYATSEPELFYWFIRNTLTKAILLPITADSQDTALTIFSTLNDRGLALSDADIFKAKIYNHLDEKGKKEFIEHWRILDETATGAGESIQRLFYYYMFYLRALENDRDTTTPGLRKYYARNSFEKLYDTEVMNNLSILLNLWIAINNREEIVGESWTRDTKIKQTLDAISSYPNEFWKYPVVIFYLKYRDTEKFDDLFLVFLRKLLADLAARYIITPTINAVKRGILNLNADIINSPNPQFSFSFIDTNELKEKIKNPHRSIVRVLLKILAYQHQTNMLPNNWEVEHILPQKWQSSYFPSVPEMEIKELIDHIGNKIPFEKKLNIIAGNGYFAKKQASYAETEVEILHAISTQHNSWGLDEIRERDIRISDELLKVLSQWGLNQASGLPSEQQAQNATPDELQLIESFRKRGLIQ